MRIASDSRHAVTAPILDQLAVLSDAIRVRVLAVLEAHELTVSELCGVLQRPQSTVSRHLKVLGDQRWVRGRREGTNHLYRMILDELDHVCHTHHDLHSHHGWALVAGTGKRPMVPPDDPRHPAHDPPSARAGPAGVGDPAA